MLITHDANESSNDEANGVDLLAWRSPNKNLFWVQKSLGPGHELYNI